MSLRARPASSLLITLLAVAITACGPAEGGAPASPGTAKGVVRNRLGAPLQDVTVRAFGTTTAGHDTSQEKRTGADGSFTMKLPDGVYGLAAYKDVTHDTRDYQFTLEAVDGITGISHDSAEGITKDFVWKLSGLKPGAAAGSTNTWDYYGGSLPVEAASGFLKNPDLAGAKIEISLTPTGPLMDGTAGTALSFEHRLEAGSKTTVPDSWSPTVELEWTVLDVPGGNYDVTARLVKSDGSMEPLGIAESYSSAPSATVSVDIRGLNLHGTAHGRWLYLAR